MFCGFKLDRDYISSGYCSTRPRPSKCPICNPATPPMTYEDYLQGHGYEPPPYKAPSPTRFRFPNYSTLFGRGIDDFICLIVTYCHELYTWYRGNRSNTTARRLEGGNSHTSNKGKKTVKRKCSCDEVVSIPGTPRPASRRTVYPTGNWKTTRKRRFVSTIKSEDELSEDLATGADHKEPRMAGITLRDLICGPPLDELLLSVFFLIYDLISPPTPGENACDSPWCSITAIRDAAATDEGGRFKVRATDGGEGESERVNDVSTMIREEGPVDLVRWLHEECLSLAQDIKDSQDEPYDCNGPLCPATLKRRQENLNALEALLETKQGLEEDDDGAKRSRIASTYHVVETQVTVMTAMPEVTRRNQEEILRCREAHMSPRQPVPVPRVTLDTRRVSYACARDETGGHVYNGETCPQTSRDNGRASGVRCNDSTGGSGLTRCPDTTRSHARRGHYGSSKCNAGNDTCGTGESDNQTTGDESSSSGRLSLATDSVELRRSRSLSAQSNRCDTSVKKAREEDGLVKYRSRSLTPRPRMMTQCPCSMQNAISLAKGVGEFICACGVKVLKEGIEMLAPDTRRMCSHGRTRRQDVLRGRGAIPPSSPRYPEVSRTQDKDVGVRTWEGKCTRDSVMSKTLDEGRVERHWERKNSRDPVMSKTQDEGRVERNWDRKSSRDPGLSKTQDEGRVERHWEGKSSRDPGMSKTQDEGIAISNRDWNRSVPEERMLRHLKEETHIEGSGFGESENETSGTSTWSSREQETGSSVSESSLVSLWSNSRSATDRVGRSSLKEDNLKKNSSTRDMQEKRGTNDTLELEMIHFPRARESNSSSDAEHLNQLHVTKSQDSLVDRRKVAKKSSLEQNNTKHESDRLHEDSKVDVQNQSRPLSTSHFEQPIFKEIPHAPSDRRHSRDLNTSLHTTSLPTIKEDTLEKLDVLWDKRNSKDLNTNLLDAPLAIETETSGEKIADSDKRNSKELKSTLHYPPPNIKKETSIEQIVNSDKRNSKELKSTVHYPPETIIKESSEEIIINSDKRNSKDLRSSVHYPPPTIKIESSVEQINSKDLNTAIKVVSSEELVPLNRRSSTDTKLTEHYSPLTIKEDHSSERKVKSDKRKKSDLNKSKDTRNSVSNDDGNPSTPKGVNESEQPAVNPRIELMNKLIQDAKMGRNRFTTMMTVNDDNSSTGGNAFKYAVSDESVFRGVACDKEPQEYFKTGPSSSNTCPDLGLSSQSNSTNDYVIIDNHVDLDSDRHVPSRKAEDDDEDYLIIERPIQNFRVNDGQVRSRTFPRSDCLIEITQNQYERDVRRHNNGVTGTVPNQTRTENQQVPLSQDGEIRNDGAADDYTDNLDQPDEKELNQKASKDLNLHSSKSVKWDPTKHVRKNTSQGLYTDLVVPEAECVSVAREKPLTLYRCPTWNQKHGLKEHSQVIPETKCASVARKKSQSSSPCSTWNRKSVSRFPPEPVPSCQQVRRPAPVPRSETETESLSDGRKKSQSFSRCATWNQKHVSSVPPEPVPTCQQVEIHSQASQSEIITDSQDSMTKQEDEKVVRQRRKDRKYKSAICTTPRVSHQRLGRTNPCAVKSKLNQRDKIKLGQLIRDIKIATDADRRDTESASRGPCVCSVIVHAGSVISSEEPRSNRTPSGVFVRPERCTCKTGATGKTKDLPGSLKQPRRVDEPRGNKSRAAVRSPVVTGPNDHRAQQVWVQQAKAEDAGSFLRPLRVVGSSESVVLVDPRFSKRSLLESLPKDHKTEQAGGKHDEKRMLPIQVNDPRENVSRVEQRFAILPRRKKNRSHPDGELQVTADGNKNDAKTVFTTLHKRKSILKQALKDGSKTNATGLMDFFKDVGKSLLGLNILGGFVKPPNSARPKGGKSRSPTVGDKRPIAMNPTHHRTESRTRRAIRLLADQGHCVQRSKTLGQHTRVSVNKLRNATEKRRNSRTSAVRKKNEFVCNTYKQTHDMYFAPEISPGRSAFEEDAVVLGQKTRCRRTRVNRAPDAENEAATQARRARRPSLARGDDQVPRHDSPRRHRHRRDSEPRRASDPRRHRDHGHEPRDLPRVPRSPGGHQRNFIVNRAEILLDDPSVKYTGKYLLREQMRIMRELQATENRRRANKPSIPLEKEECESDDSTSDSVELESSMPRLSGKTERLKDSVIPNYNIQLEAEDTHGVFDVTRSEKSVHFEMPKFDNCDDFSAAKRHGTSHVETEESASKNVFGSHDHELRSYKKTRYFGGLQGHTDSHDNEQGEYCSKVKPMGTKDISSNLKLMRSSPDDVLVSGDHVVEDSSMRDACSSLVSELKRETKQERSESRSTAVYDENYVLCGRASSKGSTEFSSVTHDNTSTESLNVNLKNKSVTVKSVLATNRSSIVVLGKTSQEEFRKSDLLMKSDPRKRITETESEEDSSVSSPKSVSRSSSNHDWSSQLPIRTVDEFLQDQLRCLTKAEDKNLRRGTRSEESVSVSRLSPVSRSSSDHDWSTKLPRRSVEELVEVQMQRLTASAREADQSCGVARSESSFSVLTDDLWSEMGTVYDNHVIT